MKMTVLFHSKTGNTEKMAHVIVKGMMAVDGVEAKAFALEAIDGDFIKESRCVVLGTPIYLATLCGAVKTWLDTGSMQYGLAGKVGGAFATAGYLHGGAEIGIQSILSHMMVLGMLAYSGGGAFGAPVIHLGPVAFKDRLADAEGLFELYGRRMAETTRLLFEAGK